MGLMSWILRAFRKRETPMPQTLVLQRIRHDDQATQGNLYLAGKRLCSTLENRPPKTPGVKEPGSSRIPEGRWQLRLRAEGGFYQRYTKRWAWHGAMVEIVLPGWKHVLFHVGNYAENTDGCVLVGKTLGEHEEEGLAVWASREAYEEVYPTLLSLASEGGFLEVRDEG